jgi:hypothetical protein
MTSQLKERESQLNTNQRAAIISILEGWDSPDGDFIFPIVEGPPGTGKTSVGVVAAARYRQEIDRPQICYCAYTHYAADRALEAFIELGFSSADVLRVVDPNSAIRYRDTKNSSYYIAFDNFGDLLPQHQRSVKRVPILITTLHGSGRVLGIQNRPLMMIDEFSQVPPTLFFSTVSKVRRSEKNPAGYALLGDPNQLPVITSQPFLRPNIGVFVVSRKEEYEPHQLELQYRMHQNICQAVNSLRIALNTYELESHQSTRNRTLTTLGYKWNENECPELFRDILAPENTCVIINTDALPGEEAIGLGSTGQGSKYFVSEAQLAANLSEILCHSYIGVNNEHLFSTVLSPYSAQIGLVKSFLPPHLQGQCVSIYQSQGREYPSVIISFARKNFRGDIGFLGDPQMRAQTYVGCSRAMAKLIILFSFETFRGHRDYDYLLERTRNALIVDANKTWSEVT